MKSIDKIDIYRNGDLDRPYWNSRNAADRFITTAQHQTSDVREFFTRIRDNKFDSSDTISLTEVNTVMSRLSHDNVSPLFCYPQPSHEKSSYSDSFIHDKEFVAHAHKREKRFCIRRNEYSGYNEQRIKFGLKFYVVTGHGYFTNTTIRHV
jgi:hypothetical protein